MDNKYIPTRTEIIDAFSDFSNVGDRDLIGYGCCENSNPETNIIFPFMTYSGGCCVTVPLKKAGCSKKCLRIWYKNMPEIEERSKIVSEGLKASRLKYFLDYKYVKSAIRINNIDCPGICMDWEECPTLAEFLKHKDEESGKIQIPTSAELTKVKENFYTLCLDLNKAGIAHGDLSSTNILVKADLNLLLIDYDSMYVPQMGKDHYKQNIEGTEGYQHKLRDGNLIAAEDNDYFSQQVIYLCLLAFEKSPGLCKKITDKNLLFYKDDFASNTAFVNSPGFKLIHELKNEELDFYLEELRIAVSNPLNEVHSIIETRMPLEQAKPLIELATYCGTCGHHFENQTDLYCPDCGTKRVTL